MTDYFKQMVSYRQYFHQHPEISFEEHNTSQYIYDILIQMKSKFKYLDCNINRIGKNWNISNI